MCSKRATILELGAGTGICGIVAAMATKRPVILTDRCDDVIDNLRQSVRLNGLEKRVQVARLAWGSGKKRDPELPAEIREHAPFKASSLVGLIIRNIHKNNEHHYFSI